MSSRLFQIYETHHLYRSIDRADMNLINCCNIILVFVVHSYRSYGGGAALAAGAGALAGTGAWHGGGP